MAKVKLSPEKEFIIREIAVMYENDFPMYDWLRVDWYNNFASKRARGVWDKEKAIQGLYNNVVPKFVKIYMNEFYGEPFRLTPEEKRIVAEDILEYMMEDLELKKVKKGSKNYKREHKWYNPSRENFWHVWRKYV